MDEMDLDFYRGEYSTERSIIVPGWPQKGLDITEYFKMALSIRIWLHCDD
jgi:hypothetical protein